jgi:hypothetical protein
MDQREVLRLCRALVSLNEAPEPGIGSWHLACVETVDALRSALGEQEVPRNAARAAEKVGPDRIERPLTDDELERVLELYLQGVTPDVQRIVADLRATRLELAEERAGGRVVQRPNGEHDGHDVRPSYAGLGCFTCNVTLVCDVCARTVPLQSSEAPSALARCAVHKKELP